MPVYFVDTIQVRVVVKDLCGRYIGYPFWGGADNKHWLLAQYFNNGRCPYADGITRQRFPTIQDQMEYMLEALKPECRTSLEKYFRSNALDVTEVH